VEAMAVLLGIKASGLAEGVECDCVHRFEVDLDADQQHALVSTVAHLAYHL